jgi:Cro/C1-type HTH DNA-binding domain
VGRSLGEIVREAMLRRGVNIKQLARLTADLGDPVSEGTVHNVLKSRVSHSRYDTIRPLCAALDLDYSAVLAEIGRPAYRVRTLPQDFHHLTDDQWRSVVELAKQFRIANEGRRRSAEPPGGGCATTESASDS